VIRGSNEVGRAFASTSAWRAVGVASSDVQPICPLARLALIFVLTLLAPCVFAQKENRQYKYKNDASLYAELAKAPRKVSQRRNPWEGDPDAVPAGANLFDQHCAECHGELAEGSHKGPNLRVDAVQQATPGTLFWLLTNGVVRRGMPVWSKLPEPQRWQLVSYLKSLAPATPPSPSTAP
jgi:mono/diheme cytochrome c family protein